MLPILLAAAALQTETPPVSHAFEVPEGVKVEVFAESPSLYNPTAIDVDEQGRVWVTEAVNYRRWKDYNQGVDHSAGDRVVVLEDTNGDGVAERSRVFVQDKELVAPLGIWVDGQDVYVSCSPHLFRYRDTDGDGKADEREIFLTGFGGFDHDHGLHSLVPHPNGDLLWCAGNAGPHVVTDRKGFTLRSGSYYNGGAQSSPGNRPGLVSDDLKVWTGGLIGTVGRDGAGLTVLAHNFRNQYEVAVDRFGTLYTSDNDDDGNEGVRTVAITPGGDYGFFGEHGTRSWQADRREGMNTQEAHWHQKDPGVMPAGTLTGSGAPCGVAVYEHELMPSLTGKVLVADAGRSLVYAFEPTVQGAAVMLQPGLLIQPDLDQSGERGRWFRPSDVAVGPRGEIYVADWYDPGVGGHWAGDRQSYGRILVLRPDGQRPDEATQQAAKAHIELLAQAQSVWHATQQPGFPNDALRARQGVLSFAFGHEAPQIRLTALRACLAHGHDPVILARLVENDPSPWVRAHAATALRDVHWSRCEVVLPGLTAHYDGQDRDYLECIGLAATGKESELYTAMLERWEPDSDFGKWLDLAWRLHPIEALEFLQRVVTDQGQDLAVRRKALDGIAFMPEQAAAEFMVVQALTGPEDARAYAGGWVKRRSEGMWSAYGLEGTLRGDFDRAEPLFQSEPITQDTQDIEVDVTGVEVLWLVVEEGDDGNGCDWAAWLDPRLETEQGTLDLREIPWSEEHTAWGSSAWDQSCDGRPLQVGGESVKGLGTHAHSRIAFPLPPGASKFLATLAPDDGGQQGACAPTVRFVVLGERAENWEAHLALQKAAVEGDGAAAQELLASVPGALFLLEAAREDRLPQAVRTAVGPKLQQHTDLSVRALATEVFPLRTTGGATLPAIAQLARLPGDVSRGRELFRTTATCTACHRFDGLGGSIGPDLTSIGNKYDRASLIDSMLNPSAALAFGYDNWNLSLKDGRHLAGSILAEGESVVLRDLAGQRHVIQAAEIASRRKSTVSTMPSALGLGLSAQDLCDLASFLESGGDPLPEFGKPIALFNGQDLSGWDFFLNQNGQRDDVWSVKDGILRCEGNPTGYLYTQAQYTNFELIVEWRFDPAVGGGNSGVLMRVRPPHKTWPRSIEAQLQSRHAGDIWNIGDFPMLTDPDRTSGRRTEKLLPTNEKPIGEWNRYRIRLHGSRLTMEVNGQVQNTATWCEEIPGVIGLQSEGVPIEFRKVELRPILSPK